MRIWTVIQLVLIVLKLTNVLNISWLWILLPIWAPIFCVMCVFSAIIVTVVIDMFRIN